MEAQNVNTGNLLRFNLINISKDCNCKLNAKDILCILFYLISCKGLSESRFFRSRFDTPVSDSREYDLTMNR